jgi:hypothetical protein
MLTQCRTLYHLKTNKQKEIGLLSSINKFKHSDPDFLSYKYCIS